MIAKPESPEYHEALTLAVPQFQLVAECRAGRAELESNRTPFAE